MAKKQTITAIPLCELVEDMDLYPRHAVDLAHVRNLTLALESGAQLPPIIADAKSKRITDGWHRARAFRRFLGDDATVDVELIHYAGEAEMVCDAVSRNSSHGRKLDAIDQTRAVVMLEQRGVETIKIAAVLNVPEERVEKLRIKVAQTRSETDGNVPGTKIITLKRPVHHMQGKTLTKAQADAHQMMPGTSFLLVATQLTTALRTELVNLEDDKLIRQLCELRDVLEERLADYCAQV